jgi:hypothetical protein
LERIQRRRRVRCRLPCEIVEKPRHRIPAVVASLSEGGLGIEADLDVEQGQELRLRILPRRGPREVRVAAIVWNIRPSPRKRDGRRLLQIGCVVSEPPPAFMELLERTERATGRREDTPLRRPAPQRASSPPAEAELPRSREPLPPPKPEPEETLPAFRARLKKVGSPRTRCVVVRAHSLAEAEERVRAGLDADDAWEVLGVSAA